MSDLQIGLLVLGAAVVGAVYAYNRLQELRLRRRLGQAFDRVTEDALLGEPREPVLASAVPEVEPAPVQAGEPRREAAAELGAAEPAFDPALEYVAEIAADAPIPEAVVAEVTRRAAECGKPTRAAGYDAQRGQWDDLARGAPGRYTRVRIALQLVNRGGPVSSAQLSAFCDALRAGAERAGARALLPETQPALEQARELDAFCARVDVAIGVNVVAREGKSFTGPRIRALAEAAGFRLEPEGVFHYRDEQRRTLFTLDNHEPAPFLPERIRSLTTRGVTLLLDVPRVADGERALARMLEIAGELATALEGRLVDDNRIALTEAGIARIREQLKQIRSAMEARGVAAGSERALRLFS
jgi:hypothetical protein